jgi:hypothetical protein
MRATTRRFAAKETTIYRDLQSSMRKLGATTLRVAARDLLNAKDVQAEVVYDRAGRRYVFRCRRWGHYEDNLRAVQLTIESLRRAAEEYGAISSTSSVNGSSSSSAPDPYAQVFLGFEATPDDTVLMLGPGRADWWEVLGVQKTASRPEVMNAYRALAKIHHPDAGGNADEFKRLRAAYEKAIEERS